MKEENKDKNIVKDNSVRISHQNILWILYRVLSENAIISEEVGRIGNKITEIV